MMKIVSGWTGKLNLHYMKVDSFKKDACVLDKNGRVFVGTESAGMLYSEDEGNSWKPADYHPCKDVNTTEKQQRYESRQFFHSKVVIQYK